MFKNIFIDYTTGIAKSSHTFHGGFSFTYWLTQELLEKYNSINILIKKEQETLFDDKFLDEFRSKINFIHIENIKKYTFPNNSVLIMPLIPNYRLKIIKEIKKINNNIKINVVIHGIRNLDLIKFDKYDKYYFNNIFYSFPLIFWFYKLTKGIVEYFTIKYFLHYADLVITVSNSTLQKLANINKKVNRITLFHQSSNLLKINPTYLEDNKKYILFLNAKRHEKNFIRGLVAFLKYKIESSDNEIYLYVTGFNSILEKNINKVLNKSELLLFKEYVKTFDYLSDHELVNLYSNSLFLLYTSKSEGYGIPILESAFFGKPILSSYLCSIPEILGSLVYYINPYDIRSIVNGLYHMIKNENYNLRKNSISKYKEIIIKRNSIEKQIVLSEIVE